MDILYGTETVPLSAALRAATEASHAAVERASPATGLASRHDYAACLARHYAVFAPAEARLACISGWRRAGIDLAAHRRVPCLLADFAALGVDPDAMAVTDIALPDSLPAGLGALYVLEGSALGGRIILRDVETRLGAAVTGATTFFGGAARRVSWPSFKTGLDAFGLADPGSRPAVIAGALATFAAFASAFRASSAKDGR